MIIIFVRSWSGACKTRKRVNRGRCHLALKAVDGHSQLADIKAVPRQRKLLTSWPAALVAADCVDDWHGAYLVAVSLVKRAVKHLHGFFHLKTSGVLDLELTVAIWEYISNEAFKILFAETADIYIKIFEVHEMLVDTDFLERNAADLKVFG